VTATQLDLFGVVQSAGQQRRHGALMCLRDAVPGALEAIAYLEYREPRDTRAPHASGDWAYCLCRAGLRFEDRHEWGVEAHLRGERSGWDRTPAHLVTWSELAALIGDDPRRGEVRAWADALPEPRWRPLSRPHELWPDPASWHIGYFCRDHLDAGWTARRQAWQLVLDLLGDAIDRVTAEDAS
jgi:hypothetical protein